MTIQTIVLYFAAGSALVASLLCLTRLLKIVPDATALVPQARDATEQIFSRQLNHSIGLFSAIYAGFLFAAYYLDYLRHANSDPGILVFSGIAFGIFFAAVYGTNRLRVFVQTRSVSLQKESTSRIFRHFLYVGALLGLSASFLGLSYAFLIQVSVHYAPEILLLPVYVGALLIFWLRFNTALMARSSDYAYELLGKQESVMPLTGASNPLWNMRQRYAAINRFSFHHLEFLLLCVVVLLTSGQLEIKAKISADGRPAVTLVIFALGLISGIPGFFIMRVRDKTSPETFLWNIRIGHIAAISILAILSYFLFVVIAQMHIKYFWIIIVGALTALMLSLYSAIYVSENHRNARSFIAAAATSVSTVIHKGIAAGMRGAAIPALIITLMMGLAYLLGVVDERGEDRYYRGLFGLAVALTSMVSLFSVTQATASIMPLAADTVEVLRLGARTESRTALMVKFKNLRGVTVPSHVVQGQIFFSALTILIFLVYAQILAEAGHATLFRHLTHTAMLLLGGIASYFLAARVNELVLNLGPLLVRETRAQFRQVSDLTGVGAGQERLGALASGYLLRKILPLFIGAMLLPALACLLGGSHGLAGYLIGFGFFSFLNGTSWLTTGAAWSSARQAAEADQQVARNTAQLEALTQADIVGDSMHEAAAPTLSIALFMTIVASIIFGPATLELHELVRSYIKGL